MITIIEPNKLYKVTERLVKELGLKDDVVKILAKSGLSVVFVCRGKTYSIGLNVLVNNIVKISSKISLTGTKVEPVEPNPEKKKEPKPVPIPELGPVPIPEPEPVPEPEPTPVPEPEPVDDPYSDDDNPYGDDYL